MLDERRRKGGEAGVSQVPRIAMIGLDAADFGFIESAVDSLPNLRRVLGGGTVQRLRSPADVLTGSVWPTFSTESDPGHHGMYHHLQWDAASMRLRRLTSRWFSNEPFWYGLERRGRKVIAVDVPLSFPSRLREGIEILNWGSHDELGAFSCRPRALEADVRRRFGRHPMGSEIPVGKETVELLEIRDKLVRGARLKGALVRWLLDRAPWDFFIAVFGETHRGGHILWPEGPGSETIPSGALLDVYRAVDGALGEVLAAPALEGARVIVFALHGMRSNISQEHFVPAVMDLVNSRFLGVPGAEGPRSSAPRPGIVRLLRERLPSSLQNRVAQLVPVSVRDAVVNRSIVAGHDWSRTLGFDLLSDLNGYLRLNIRGRERDGVLERGTEVFEKYVAWVRESFSSLRVAGSEEPIVAKVDLITETFPGPRADHLPDLVVRWTGRAPVSRIDSPILGPVTASLATGRSGNHHREGFCVAFGPGAPLPPLADGRELGSFVARSLA